MHQEGHLPLSVLPLSPLSQVIKWFNIISKRTLLDPLAAHDKAQDAPAGTGSAGKDATGNAGVGGSSAPPFAVAGASLVCVDGTIVKQEGDVVASSSVGDGSGEDVAASLSAGSGGAGEDGGVDFEDGEIVDGNGDEEVRRSYNR